MKALVKQSFTLSIFFFLLLFLSGRTGLLLHEFAGHTFSWHLLGGNISEFRLFLFGGGRVHYEWTPAVANLPEASILFVQLSGISVELATGLLLGWLAQSVNASRPINALLIATASLLLVHSFFYLFVCAYYGYGDGVLLFKGLQGNVRLGFLFIAFSSTIGAAFLVSFFFSPVVRSWLAERNPKKQLVVVVLSGLVAVLLHGTFTLGEQIWMKDTVYAGIKTPEKVRWKEKELQQFILHYKQEQGREPEKDEIAFVAKELEKKYSQFPIELPLGGSVLAALILGFHYSRERNPDRAFPVTLKENALLGSVSVLAAILILLLNRRIFL